MITLGTLTTATALIYGSTAILITTAWAVGTLRTRRAARALAADTAAAAEQVIATATVLCQQDADRQTAERDVIRAAERIVFDAFVASIVEHSPDSLD